MSKKNVPVIAGVQIQTNHRGLYDLSALHEASGGEDRHKPGNWLATNQAKDMIAFIQKDGSVAIETSAGRYGGTFACRDMIVSYAMWISAEFHLQVVRTFNAVIDGDIKKALSEAEKAQVAFCRDLLKDPEGNRIDVDDVKYQIAYLEGDKAGMARIERKHEAEKVRLETTLAGQVETKMPKGPGYEVTISVPDAIQGTPEEVLAEIKRVAKKRKYKIDVMEQSGRTFLIETW